VEKGVEQLLVTVKEWVEFMGKRKDYMEIRGVDHFGTAFIHPDFF
jgi:hypothetical protein